MKKNLLEFEYITQLVSMKTESDLYEVQDRIQYLHGLLSISVNWTTMTVMQRLPF